MAFNSPTNVPPLPHLECLKDGQLAAKQWVFPLWNILLNHSNNIDKTKYDYNKCYTTLFTSVTWQCLMVKASADNGLSVHGVAGWAWPLLAFVVFSFSRIYRNIHYQSCKMKHEMIQWSCFDCRFQTGCLEMFYSSHTLFLWPCMLSCGALQWNWTYGGSA